ncbi:MAG: HYR domain-containing protein [Saprospiraceae bacterium]|nr:HYR domain-containing protein [Saprospiraceae bacterium]
MQIVVDRTIPILTQSSEAKFRNTEKTEHMKSISTLLTCLLVFFCNSIGNAKLVWDNFTGNYLLNSKHYSVPLIVTHGYCKEVNNSSTLKLFSDRSLPYLFIDRQSTSEEWIVKLKVMACVTPVIVPTNDLVHCNGESLPSFGFQSSNVAPATHFNWVKTSTAAGEATNIPLSGTNTIPTYTASNNTCGILVDTIIVTPVDEVTPIDICFGIPDTFLISTLPTISMTVIRDSSFCNGDSWTPQFNSSCPDSTVFHWLKRPGPGGTTLPGVALSGVGNLPALNIVNPPPSCLILTDTFIVTPYYKSNLLNDSCPGNVLKFIVKSVPTPVVTATRDTAYCRLTNPQGFNFTTTCPVGSVIRWRKRTLGGILNTGTSIAQNGIGNIPPFLTFNPGTSIRVDTIIVYATFVSVGDSCVGPRDTFFIRVLPTPSVNAISDAIYCHGTKVPDLTFTGNVNGAHYNWTATGPNIGISSSGTDIIPMFMVNNTSSGILSNTITVTPVITFNNVSCSGPSRSFLISAYPQPQANCNALQVYLNNAGSASLTSADINNGSVGLVIGVNPSNFNCTNIGVNMVTLTVRDSCNNTSSCIANVTVLDTIRPQLSCSDQVYSLQSSSCEVRFNYLPTATDNCSGILVEPQDTNFRPGKLIATGKHNVCYTATDNSGNTSVCCIEVNVLSNSNPIGSMTCVDNIQISLDENCYATVSADAFLVGGPYRCFNEYKVKVQLWNGGSLIDRDPLKAGVQVSYQDIGHELKVTITDTVSGNNCWSRASVEDKLPPIFKECPSDITINCNVSTDPINTAYPVVYENCGTYTLSFTDVRTKGSCDLGTAAWIRRTWVAIDAIGNSSFCIQNITVNYIDVDLVNMPPDYNGYITQNGIYSLSCDGRLNQNFDLSKHIKPYPDCIDDYLLDHQEFIATGRRIPKKLGWNIFTSGPYSGHPHTDPIYYPSHQDANGCWGANKVIMWEGTGRPQIEGCENIGVSFSDLILNTSKNGCNAGPVGCFKVLRTWTLLDWCSSKVRTHQQLIKVSDDEGPQIIYPDSIELNTTAHHCSALWEIKDVWLKDQCSEDLHYNVISATGSVLGDENAGYIVTDLGVGTHIVTITAEDCCGNISTKDIVVIVIDKTPPTAICQAKTVTSILGAYAPFDNLAVVKSASFDDGSFDNCSPHVFFKSIRMDELSGTINGSDQPSTLCFGANGDDNKVVNGSQVYFDDEVKFCCDDVGQTRMVVFRVFDVDPGVGPVNPSRMNLGGDLEGHYSDCMVEVTVQNKATPTLVAPSDIVVSCDWWFDDNRLTDPKDSLFGQVVFDIAWRRKVKTIDKVCATYCYDNDITKYPGSNSAINSAPYKACQYYSTLYNSAHPEQKYELVWGFDGYLHSGCGANFTITVDDQRSCGQGKIIRTFTTPGPGGQNITAQQIIWVVDCDPFWINPENHCDTTDDIIWPDCQGLGTRIYDCGANTSPDITGRPIVLNDKDDHCTLVAVEYKDQYYTTEQDACYVIFRKWTVIDWCQYDPKFSETIGRWDFTQIIKVNDREKPIVSCKVGDCEPANFNSTIGTCFGHISLTATAVDSCTQSNWLSFEYKIDLYDDGTVDYTVGALNKKQFDSGQKPSVKNNPAADNANNPFDASGNYPLGVHEITWYVSDGCDNVGTCSALFEIKDCKAPTPYCLTGIITVPMPSTGCIDIWAKDLDFASFDNCTPKNKLKFYFDSIPTNTSLKVCCEDFVKNKINDELVIPVRVWVEDEEGNRDYCNTIIVVQDNQNICENVGTFRNVSGEIRTPAGISTGQVTVDLYEQGQLHQSKSTTSNGLYKFDNLIDGYNYILKPTRNDNHLNGVSTADIVKIQKHILGKEFMYSPFQLIAADVNNSKSITSADISEIRKLILGVIPEFSKVPSWKLLEYPTEFEDPSNPYIFNSETSFKMQDKSLVYDFTAVKMGDVNATVVVNSNNNLKSRSEKSFSLIVADQQLTGGTKAKIEFRAKDLIQLNGFQFTFNFNNRLMKFVDFEDGVIDIEPIHYNALKAADGILTLSWNNRYLTTLHRDEIVFSLDFEILGETRLVNNLSISSDITNAEAYNENMEVLDIDLRYIQNGQYVETGMFEILSVQPNPFQVYTDIVYRLQNSGPVRITLYDPTGRVHKIIPLQGVKGINSYRISKNDFQCPGMYYYQIDSENHTATGKLILTN